MMRGALELFAEQGFEKTTALEVAERAGVTERTFYRYFADKREVLFSASGDLQDAIVAAIGSAPASQDPLGIVVAAMEIGVAPLEENRPYSQARAKVITENASLQERELLKLHTLAHASSTALRARGVPPLTADVAAESAVTMFKIGFETWISNDTAGTFAQCIRSSFDQLRTLTRA